MRARLLLALAFLLLATSPAAAAPEPMNRCGAGWLPAFIFTPGESFLSRDGDTMLHNTIRHARYCRYRQLRVVVFIEGASGGELAAKRANTLKDSLFFSYWPRSQIAVTLRAAGEAPLGHDVGDKTFTPDALIEYADPDPAWTPPPPGEICEGGMDKPTVCRPDIPGSAIWISQAWPSLGIHMPMIFFASQSSELDERILEVVAEAARRFKSANCRILSVEAYADSAERDPVELSLRRAETSRAELIRLGVAPSALTIGAFGASNFLVPTDDGVAEAQNRRVAFGCGD